MAKNRIRNGTNANNTLPHDNLDKRDQQILSLLLSGKENRVIATKLGIPMSTVQRRTRKLFEKNMVKVTYELNYKKLGFRKGLLHVYLKNGNLQGIANQIARIRGMRNTSIHIGNSDIVGFFVFSETQHLLDIMSECRRIDGVERVVWSEEVMTLPEESGIDRDKLLLS